MRNEHVISFLFPNSGQIRNRIDSIKLGKEVEFYSLLLIWENKEYTRFNKKRIENKE